MQSNTLTLTCAELAPQGLVAGLSVAEELARSLVGTGTLIGTPSNLHRFCLQIQKQLAISFSVLLLVHTLALEREDVFDRGNLRPIRPR